MANKRITHFFIQVIIAGIVAAGLLLYFFPELLGEQTPEVNISTAADQPITQRSQGPVSYADAVNRASPSVVNIYTSKTITRELHPFFDDPLIQRFFGYKTRPRTETQNSLGSGVIFSSGGYIITNHHVIDGADTIQVLLPTQETHLATIVGTDPETDLAVLQVPDNQLKGITLGSSESLAVGDVALAIGNPFGVGQTVTQGIISAKGRHNLGINTYENFIQTDAAINPGNSGGALVNAFGELIGINTAIFSKSGGSHGIGFAIPVDLVRDVFVSIVQNGEVIRGWIGMEGQNMTPELAEALKMDIDSGVIITGVSKQGPGDLAGIRPRDVIISMNGETIVDATQVLNLVASTAPGDSINMTYVRDGKELTTQIEIMRRPRDL